VNSDYIAPEYSPPSSVEIFGGVPRFGHFSDISLIITGEGDYMDYIMGTIFIPIFVLSVFVVWIILILMFKMCGKTVGLLSGRRLDDRSPHWFVRTIVMISAAFGLAAGAMYLVKATSSLSSTFDSIREGALGISELADNVTQLADDLIQAGAETVPVRNFLVELIDDGVCSSFSAGNGDSIEIDSQAQEVVDVLTDLNDFTSDELIEIRDTFATEFNSLESEVLVIVDDSERYASISYYAIGIVVLSSILYLGAYMAWFAPQVFTTLKGYFCVQTWIILPVYFLMLIATAIITAALGVTLVVISDVCTSGATGGPQSLIETLMDVQEVTGMTRDAIDYYLINGCNGTFNGLYDLNDLVYGLEDAQGVCIDLQAVMNEDISTFEQACGGGPGDLDPVDTALAGMELSASSFLRIGYETQEVLSCENLNSIYIELAHGSMCTYLPQTLAWMFTTMSIILGSGMMLFTLRAALLPDKDRHDYSRHDKNGRGKNSRGKNHRRDKHDYDEDFDDENENETREYAVTGYDENEGSDHANTEQGSVASKSVVSKSNKSVSDNSTIFDGEVEVTRLPTNDLGEAVEVQVSSRQL